jgi:hypothetical protein
MVDISSVLGDVPVTPLKVGGTSLYPADATAAVLNVPLRLGHESPDEVSPASTYADTAAGSSGPVTPYVFVGKSSIQVGVIFPAFLLSFAPLIALNLSPRYSPSNVSNVVAISCPGCVL